MPDPITAAGLASSIITFLTLAAQVTKHAHEFSRLAGELPADLQSCKDIVEVIERSSKRIHAQLSTTHDGPLFGPRTAVEADLETLFHHCALTTESLIKLFDEINGSISSFSKALKAVRKQGRIQQIRNDLQQQTLVILYVLEESSKATTAATREIVTDLMHDLLRFHQQQESLMTTGFRQLAESLNGGKDELLADITRLQYDQEMALRNSQLKVLAGQEDLQRNLDRLSENFSDALRDNEMQTASKMEKLLHEHQAASQALVAATAQTTHDSMLAQIQQLNSGISATLVKIESIRNDSAEKVEKEGLHIRADFEFSFRSEILTFHIRHCTEWVSSTLFARKSLLPTRRGLFIPIPRFRTTKPHQCCHETRAATTKTVDVIIQYQPNQYHLVKIDMSNTVYNYDVAQAIRMEYSRYRSWYWKLFSFEQLSGIEYVKYSAYSDLHQSYQFVEPIKPDHNLGPTPCQVFSYVKMNLRDCDGRLQSLIHDERGSKERAQIGHALYLQESLDTHRYRQSSLVGAFLGYLLFALPEFGAYTLWILRNSCFVFALFYFIKTQKHSNWPRAAITLSMIALHPVLGWAPYILIGLLFIESSLILVRECENRPSFVLYGLITLLVLWDLLRDCSNANLADRGLVHLPIGKIVCGIMLGAGFPYVCAQFVKSIERKLGIYLDWKEVNL